MKQIYASSQYREPSTACWILDTEWKRILTESLSPNTEPKEEEGKYYMESKGVLEGCVTSKSGSLPVIWEAGIDLKALRAKKLV